VSGSAEVTLEIRNPSGLHARPAATFVRAASAFASEIDVTNHDRDDRTASAKSILGVMGLGVSRGHRVTLRATGADAQAAISALTTHIEVGIGEGTGAP
jgi:phosphotransferase system HPr (HPr) family protein